MKEFRLVSSDFRQFHSQTVSRHGTKPYCLKSELVPYSDVDCTLYITPLQIPTCKLQNLKLYIFSQRGEYLAVRNDEQGFFLCQAHQNIYRASKKIKIQWLSQSNDESKQVKQGDVYVKEFYDNIGNFNLLFCQFFHIEGHS